MNEIYKEIQGVNAKPIRLELPGEDDTNQQRMANSRIDFADNRQSVAPAGYLSDLRIYLVALALRLAAIRKFNGAAPVIALTTLSPSMMLTIAGRSAHCSPRCSPTARSFWSRMTSASSII